MKDKSIVLSLIGIFLVSVLLNNHASAYMIINGTVQYDKLGVVRGTVSSINFNDIVFTSGKVYPFKGDIEKINLDSKIRLVCFGFFGYSISSNYGTSTYPNEIKYCEIQKGLKQ